VLVLHLARLLLLPCSRLVTGARVGPAARAVADSRAVAAAVASSQATTS